MTLNTSPHALFSLSGGLLLVGANGIQGRDGMMNRRKTRKMAVVPSDTKLQKEYGIKVLMCRVSCMHNYLKYTSHILWFIMYIRPCLFIFTSINKLAACSV